MHLTADRLEAADLDEEELDHLVGCVRCRADRRARVGRMVPRAPLPTLGRFELQGQLGAGGMAEVFAARDPATGASFALKRLRLARPGLGERLAREASAQARVDHPFVLPLLEVIDDHGSPVLVLPRVHGPSLDRVLAKHKLSAADASFVFRAMVEGLAAIHAAGMVHRDVKPGNVLLDAGGDTVVPRICDFGLAKLLMKEVAEAQLTATGAMLGTPAYAAPEQLADPRSVDARADLWGLGATLYELISGRRHAAESARQTLPEPFDSLVADLLAVDPERRPANAGELLARLPLAPDPSPALHRICSDLAPGVRRTFPPAAAIALALRSGDGTLEFVQAGDLDRARELVQAAGAGTAIGVCSSPVDPRGTARRLAELAAHGQALSTIAPTGAPFVGWWTLSPGAEPIRVFELGEVPFGPPSDPDGSSRREEREGRWVETRPPPHDLPVETDAFVGRRDLLATLGERLGSGGRVALRGPPGSGRARLALRFARTHLHRWSGGAWWFGPGREPLVDGDGPRLWVVEGAGRAAFAARAPAGVDVLLLPGDEPVTGDWTVLDVPPLDRAEARALLGARCAEGRRPPVPLAPTTCRSPLAIELVAGGAAAATTLDEVIAGVAASLSTWDRAVLHVVSGHPRGLTIEDLEARLPADPDAPWTLDIVERLVMRALLRRRPGYRLVVHPALARAFGG